MSGFYDPRFYNSTFPFYDMQQQQMLLPFVFNASTSPAVSPKTANNPKELMHNQVFQLLVLLAQKYQVQALWKKTMGRKESQKHMTNGPKESNKYWFGYGLRGSTDLKAKMWEKKFGTKSRET